MDTQQVDNDNIWKRPKNVPYPSIWSKFECVDKNGITRKFFIQDITEDMYPFIVEHMHEVYIRDEPISKSVDLYSDEESKLDLNEIWFKALQQKMGIVCFEENPYFPGKPLKFIGCNILAVTQKKCDIFEALKFTLKGEKLSKIFQAYYSVLHERDPYKDFNIDLYLNGLGLSVVPMFRRLGIAKELIKARNQICKACEVPMILNAFTSIASQRAAERVGYLDYITTDYTDIAKRDPNLYFPVIDTKSLRFLYKKVV